MRSQKKQVAKDTFSSAVGRVHVIANAHDHLLPQDIQASIDRREYLTKYLTKCFQNLGDALRDVRPIAINVTVADIFLSAFKYAFSDEQSGIVAVKLERASAKFLTLIIEDNSNPTLGV
jgi:two-component sensor histidine kinase